MLYELFCFPPSALCSAIVLRADRRGVIAGFASGLPFTSRVDGDVNADDAANDPAFIVDPSQTRGMAFARAMRRLIAEAPVEFATASIGS